MGKAFWLGLAIAIAVMALANSAFGQDQRAEPEAASGRAEKMLVRGQQQMVVAAHPLASRAGREMLRAGGTAMDAAIAAQMVLNVVEPQSSGIGGGAFLLYWDAETETLTAYDGREVAPRAATPDRFLDEEGARLPFGVASTGGLAVGVPGLLRMLEMAHRAHGRLDWTALFDPAIDAADRGFEVTARLNMLLRRSAERLGPRARSYFFGPQGAPVAPGRRLRNADLAETFRRIAAGGADAFYRGPIAQDIVETVRSAARNPGDMTLADLADYRAKAREPVCGPYRAYRVCGMGPPTSGGLTVLQVLMMLERFDLGEEPLNGRALHLIAEAQKLAYADRGKYMADADFVDVPKGLIDRDYLRARSERISPHRAMDRAAPGDPPGSEGVFGNGESADQPGTSHISVIDAQGNVVSMTSSIERAFGSGLMVRGFLLNNQLTDFSFRPTDADGRPVANRVEAGKRPRSSMSPTVAFADEEPAMVTGSPGGSRIILYTLKSLIGAIDWKLDAQEAVSLPNFGSRGGRLDLEAGHDWTPQAERLRGLGHNLRETPMTSGIHMIIARDGVLEGGADPRRDGMALAD
ncbi:gamma-glutamyltransferase [Dichotomicrobium thermohalophilum]|uniref:Glutathione hydrolase proenzyme n=1 Tax=Dichotomicrobium thermohalophilum TaxID=933063 RepID=A0A397Q879_9HYPH|nr:gamma-glutamyltransferase [Dichotomicrobium thermohalophilum]RIA55727.1 gamma-glutamyltranspeptidase/glutathione hydrolase [Dichotomicrobium thermohalophilum]